MNTAFLRFVASGYCDERAGIKIYCTVLEKYWTVWFKSYSILKMSGIDGSFILYNNNKYWTFISHQYQPKKMFRVLAKTIMLYQEIIRIILQLSSCNGQFGINILALRLQLIFPLNSSLLILLGGASKGKYPAYGAQGHSQTLNLWWAR